MRQVTYLGIMRLLPQPKYYEQLAYRNRLWFMDVVAQKHKNVRNKLWNIIGISVHKCTKTQDASMTAQQLFGYTVVSM